MKFSEGKPYPYGATVNNNGVNFAVYAKDASHVTLCLYQNGVQEPFEQIPMVKTGQIWHIHVSNFPSKTYYDYCVSRENNDPIKLLDPYAKAIQSDATWNSSSTNEYRPLGKVVTNNNFDWQETKPLRIPFKDLIIYEMHVRGFTADPSSKVKNPGSYLGVIEKLPYLKNLGINAIELMPLFEFNEKEVPFVHPKTKVKLVNFFGYSTVSFFSPMNRFASDPSGENAIIEFKKLIRECHKNGIEVILDVVFNHTNEGGSTGPLISFKGFDLLSYYLIDANGQFMNFTGCGNTVNSNNPIVIDFILDALRYWAIEMHVDGFRFDLASIMTRNDKGMPVDNAPLVEAIAKDPMLADTKLIAEAWDAAGLYQLGHFGSDRWAEWNGKYRDSVRRFIKGTPDQKDAFGTALAGSQDLYGNSKNPICSINFITCHDGFTLQDLVSYNDKHNVENGEDNRDGNNQNDSWNCGVEGPSRNIKIITLRERQKRNLILALMVSQGVPMVLMGDEYGHTKKGNNNTWCQDNRLNWFLWDEQEKEEKFQRFFRNLIKYRKEHALFKKGTFLSDQEITWHGLKPNDPQWMTENHFLAFSLNEVEKGPQIYVAFNADHISHLVSLPPLGEDRVWRCVVNTHNESPNDFYEEDKRPEIQENEIHLYARSAILLENAELQKL